jgi:hypothetical protein
MKISAMFLGIVIWGLALDALVCLDSVDSLSVWIAAFHGFVTLFWYCVIRPIWSESNSLFFREPSTVVFHFLYPLFTIPLTGVHLIIVPLLYSPFRPF